MENDILSDLERRLNKVTVAKEQTQDSLSEETLANLAMLFLSGDDIEAAYPDEWVVLATNSENRATFWEIVHQQMEQPEVMADKNSIEDWSEELSLRDRLPPVAVVEAESLTEWRISWHETVDRINYVTNEPSEILYRSAVDREKIIEHLEQTVSVPNGELEVTLRMVHTKGSPFVEPSLFVDFFPSEGEKDIERVGISLKWGEYVTYKEDELGTIDLDSAELSQITDHPLDLQIKTIT